MRRHMGEHSDSTVLSYETSLGHLGMSPMPCLFTGTRAVDGLTASAYSY